MPFYYFDKSFKLMDEIVSNNKVDDLLIQNLVSYLVQTRKFTVLDREYMNDMNSELNIIKTNQTNIEELKNAISKDLNLSTENSIVITNSRHLEALKNSLNAIESVKKGLKDGNWVYYSTNGSKEKIKVQEYGDLIKTLTKENGKVKTIQH